MKKLEKRLNEAFIYFKKSYKYKMGGSQEVILPNGKSKIFNDKEVYKGRASKYNSGIKYDEIGVVKVSRKEYSEFLNYYKVKEIALEKRNQRILDKKRRIIKAQIDGLYSVATEEFGNYIELSTAEEVNRFFDAKRLAATLDINEEDALLLNSSGKTYVFAKQITTGRILEIYHPSLDYNHLSISFSYPTEERIKSFNKKEWSSAPYAREVGDTPNNNHFVC